LVKKAKNESELIELFTEADHFMAVHDLRVRMLEGNFGDSEES